jgi:hypothetical protein
MTVDDELRDQLGRLADIDESQSLLTEEAITAVPWARTPATMRRTPHTIDRLRHRAQSCDDRMHRDAPCDAC